MEKLGIAQGHLTVGGGRCLRQVVRDELAPGHVDETQVGGVGQVDRKDDVGAGLAGAGQVAAVGRLARRVGRTGAVLGVEEALERRGGLTPGGVVGVVARAVDGSVALDVAGVADRRRRARLLQSRSPQRHPLERAGQAGPTATSQRSRYRSSSLVVGLAYLARSFSATLRTCCPARARWRIFGSGDRTIIACL